MRGDPDFSGKSFSSSVAQNKPDPVDNVFSSEKLRNKKEFGGAPKAMDLSGYQIKETKIWRIWRMVKWPWPGSKGTKLNTDLVISSRCLYFHFIICVSFAYP